MKRLINKSTKILLASAIVAAPLAANAGLLKLDGHVDNPRILAGDEPGLVAPLVPAGDFTGVVSINIRTPGRSGICTGTVISKRHVITAAHCVDTADGGTININNAGTDVRVVFNTGEDWFTEDGPASSLVTASKVRIHPDYEGFGICGPGDSPGLGSQCLGDDIAVLTLPTDVPEGVEISKFYQGGEPINGSTIWTMVGHGTTGNGIDGDIAGSASFFNKRFGFNIPELFECDDDTTPASGGFTTSAACQGVYGTSAEVWRADFDGIDETGELQDTWCSIFGVGCGNVLGQDFAGIFEANIGGGDSGGPSFVFDTASNSFQLIGNNTFGSGDGSFGSGFGGNIFAPYLDWIQAVTVNAPAGIAFLMLPFVWMGLRRRK